MKREDIYIEVTPDTVGAYVAVLEKQGEKLGDMSVTGGYRVLCYLYAGSPLACWFVGINDYAMNGTAAWTPEQLDQWLTEQKAAESKDVHAEPSEPSEPSEPAERVLLHRLRDNTYASVRRCPDYVVVERHDGTLLTGSALIALALCWVLVQSYRRATKTTGGLSRKISRHAKPYLGQRLAEPFETIQSAHNAARRVRRGTLGTAPGKSRRRWFVPPRS